MWVSVSPAGGLVASVALAAAFVGSLYIWSQSTTVSRDNPQQIRRRYLSIGIVCLLSPLLIWTLSEPHHSVDAPPLWVWIGFPSHALLPALTLPLLLTASLFIGPMVQYFLSLRHLKEVQSDIAFMLSGDRLLITSRDLIVGPFCEEFVFRACISTLLIAGGWGLTFTVLASPILFGVAHLHHLINHMRAQFMPFHQALFTVLFQLCYTTLFGSYASFVFIRTGHVTAAFLCHAFCNMMGFPRLYWLDPDYPHRKTIMAAFIVGILCFSCFLSPLLSASLYHSWPMRLIALKEGSIST